MDNENFKVKDSYGEIYEIPISRPDSLQVQIRLKYIIPRFPLYAIGKANATGWITKQWLQFVRLSSESSKLKILHRKDFQASW